MEEKIEGESIGRQRAKEWDKWYGEDRGRIEGQVDGMDGGSMDGLGRRYFGQDGNG